MLSNDGALCVSGIRAISTSTAAILVANPVWFYRPPYLQHLMWLFRRLFRRLRKLNCPIFVFSESLYFLFLIYPRPPLLRFVIMLIFFLIMFSIVEFASLSIEVYSILFISTLATFVFHLGRPIYLHICSIYSLFSGKAGFSFFCIPYVFFAFRNPILVFHYSGKAIVFTGEGQWGEREIDFPGWGGR